MQRSANERSARPPGRVVGGERPTERARLLLTILLCALSLSAAPASHGAVGGVVGPYLIRRGTSGRISSWDRTGGNRDFVSVPAGASYELATIPGPGVVTHLYLSPGAAPLMLRDAVLRFYWDDEPHPSVEVPFGDFFCAGDANPRLFSSYFVAVNHGAFTIAYHSYFPMPFRSGARLVISNEGPEPIPYLWYHVDYERFEVDPPPEMAYFHAHWRRENPTTLRREGPGCVPEVAEDAQLWDGVNLTGDDNYVILDAAGEGHLVGLFLTVHNQGAGWYGEGDDMIFVDGEEWPPSYHGTGTEEIFGGGACPNLEFSGLYSGFLTIQDSRGTTYQGQNSMYRWFVHDPIRFRRSIRWTVEHGHANNFSNDYSSVAYWYQTEPHRPFPPLSDARRPGVPDTPPPPAGAEVFEAEQVMEEVVSGLAFPVLPLPVPRGDNGVVFVPDEVGARLSFAIEVPVSGDWGLRSDLVAGSNGGLYRVLVDDRDLGIQVDLYHQGRGWGPFQQVLRREIALGDLELAAGSHTVTFEAIGKHDGSTGLLLAVDRLILMASTDSQRAGIE